MGAVLRRREFGTGGVLKQSETSVPCYTYSGRGQQGLGVGGKFGEGRSWGSNPGNLRLLGLGLASGEFG